MKQLENFSPRLLGILREGYDRKMFVNDLLAGITVSVIALPLAMALAIASGVKPEQGLYTAIIAGFLISALGGSRVQIGGPTGAFVIIVLSVVNAHGYEGLAAATLLAGGILIILGLAGFGRMIKFIPYPLTTGFTAGIALIIFTTQVKDFFGLVFETRPETFLESWELYAQHAGTANPAAFLVGAGALLLIIAFRRFAPRIPGPLVAVILASAVAGIFGLPVETIGSRFGGIPSSLPAPHFPAISFEDIRLLSSAALTIALLAGIESLLSAVVADGMSGDRHDSNTELVAQGIANIGSVVFLGIPATGAIARTATNIKSGARSPVSGIVHAAMLLLFMVLLAPLASRIPLAALSAILFVVAWNMSHFQQFRYLLAAPKSDSAVMITAFLLTVLVDLTVAVEVGVVLSAILFMKRMSDVADPLTVGPVFQDEPTGSGAHEQPRVLEAREVPPGVQVFRMTGPFFFGVADRLKDVLHAIEKKPKVFILRMRLVPVIDATGMHALRDLHGKCRRDGAVLLLSGVQTRVLKHLEKIGLYEEIGAENFLPNVDAALARARMILEQSGPHP